VNVGATALAMHPAMTLQRTPDWRLKESDCLPKATRIACQIQ